MKRKTRLIIIILILICCVIAFDINSKMCFNAVSANTINETKSVPVLMYHSVSDSKSGLFITPKSNFNEQMKYLKNEGYNAISLNELYQCLTLGKNIPNKPIVITFDDGYQDNYDNAYPILKKCNLKATIFVITDNVDKNSYYMNSKELKEVSNNNIEIESHTTKHQKLNKYDYKQQLSILHKSKIFLEKLLNKKVDYIAYPFGKNNKDTEKAVKDAGYKMGFTTKFGQAHSGQGIYKLKRIYVPGNINLRLFKHVIKLP